MPIPLSVKSNGAFAQRLKDSAQAWFGTSALGARLHVPDELAWWYWQEYGTGGVGDKGGVPYSIDPVEGTYLVYPGPGGKVFSKGVVHPGIKPRRMVTKVLPEIQKNHQEKIQQAMLDGAVSNPAILQAALVAAVQEDKRLIVASIAQNVTGTREPNAEFPKQGGKLGGKTAASVFDELATVVEIE